MNINKHSFLKLLIFSVLITVSLSYAQMQGLHGDFAEHRNGVHAANQFRTTIYNDGGASLTVNSITDSCGGRHPALPG